MIAICLKLCGLFFWLFPQNLSQSALQKHPWPHNENGEVLVRRFETPEGFTRLTIPNHSFGAWLRTLPLLPRDQAVFLFDGRKKGNQQAHAAVFDIDVGQRDLQQCADAVMRLRAEYLFARNRDSAISFNFTSGHTLQWSKWREGLRPNVSGNHVSFSKNAGMDDSYSSFRGYLNTVFAYAGSASLVREMKRVAKPDKVQPGDVFIQGGFPGHAVMVVDVAENVRGEHVFLLAQSYMPAQQIHILVQPGNASPWYAAKSNGTLVTPEWRFHYSDLHRF